MLGTDRLAVFYRLSSFEGSKAVSPDPRRALQADDVNKPFIRWQVQFDLEWGGGRMGGDVMGDTFSGHLASLLEILCFTVLGE